MKKLLSVLTAVCIMLCSCITAFAANGTPSAAEVEEQITSGGAYVAENGGDYYGAPYTVDKAYYFAQLAVSGADISDYSDAFVADVKANLEANDGKIVSSYGESLATYASVIAALTFAEEDPEDFYGYDIVSQFLAMDPTVLPASPNFYNMITLVAYYYDDEPYTFLEKVCDTYIDNYYTEGKGADYYGYSCDNTAYFALALSNAYSVLDKYKDVLDDAMTVIDSYKVDGGYIYSSTDWYGNPVTEPNCDSTALALAAKSSYIMTGVTTANDAAFSEIDAIYEDLCSFESDSTGVFTYDGDESAYATVESVIALSYYYPILVYREDNADDDTTTTTDITESTTKASDSKSNSTTSATTATKANTSKTSPATGADTAVVAVIPAAGFAFLALAIAKKRK